MSEQRKNLYATRVLTAVAGCERSAFAKWRDRNGLLPREESGWLFWSFADICTARFVVVLTRHGLSSFQSCAIVNSLICFEALIDWSFKPEPGFFVIYNRDGERAFHKCSAEKLVRILAEEADEVLTVVNIAKIIEYCREQLDDFAYRAPEERLFPCKVVENGEERTEYLPMQHRPAVIDDVSGAE